MVIAMIGALTGCGLPSSWTGALTQNLLGTIRIAIDLPMPERNGALLAIVQANKPAYGVENFRIQPVIIDPPSATYADGERNIKKILADRRITALIGPSTSDAAKAMILRADQNGTLSESMAVVAPFLTDPCLTVRTDGCPHGYPEALYPRFDYTIGVPTRVRNFYRLSPTTLVEGPAGADYAVSELDTTTAMVIDDGHVDGKQFTDPFARRFRIKGGTVAGTASYDFTRSVFTNFSLSAPASGSSPVTQSPGGPDPLLAGLQQAAKANVDVVVFGGSDAEAAAVRTRMLQAGFSQSTPLLGSDAIKSDVFTRAAGSAADGTYSVFPQANALDLDDAQDFLDAFRKVFPRPADFDGTVPYAYDATNAVITTIRAYLHNKPAASPPRDDINTDVAALNFNYNPDADQGQIQYQGAYGGALGRVKFDLNGDATPKIFSFYTVTKGQWVYQDQQSFFG